MSSGEGLANSHPSFMLVSAGMETVARRRKTDGHSSQHQTARSAPRAPQDRGRLPPARLVPRSTDRTDRPCGVHDATFLHVREVVGYATVRNICYSGNADQSLDCVQFQELMLGSKLVFIGGMAEAKSKGRGEECISQNLRILRGQNGRRAILFFANSQRRELKRYVSIPRKCFPCPINQLNLSKTITVSCVESVKPPKKPGRPVVVGLNPNFDILSQMRNLKIEFIDNDGQ